VLEVEQSMDLAVNELINVQVLPCLRSLPFLGRSHNLYGVVVLDLVLQSGGNARLEEGRGSHIGIAHRRVAVCPGEWNANQLRPLLLSNY
jgi:hypothetical protein